MPWLDALAELNAAVLDPEHGVGEYITLADATELQAVFSPGNEPGWAFGAGVTEALDAMPQPAVQVLAADYDANAEQLAVGQALSARGTQYLVAEPGEPDGHGLVRVALMPAQDQDDPTSGAGDWRWR